MVNYSSLFRSEYGRMVSALTSLLGIDQLELAQDIAQDSLLQAMQSWRFGQVPDQPAAWLHRVARNKAIDHLRRQQRMRAIRKELAFQSEADIDQAVEHCFLEQEISDSQLRMIFAACHPAIAPESQIAFALRTLCGLTVEEIANAFIVETDIVAKRIYRAREKIRQQELELAVPQGAQLGERLDVVLKTIYLLFNEGYLSTRSSQAVREDLCREAMRLCQLLLAQPATADPRCEALMALMCFQASRLPARVNAQNQLVLLQDQNRRHWFRPLMEEGFRHLSRSISSDPPGSYQLQAAIAALHASAASFDDTDWQKIYILYQQLFAVEPGPMVALNKAIAAGFAVSPARAIEELEQITTLSTHHLYHAALGQARLNQGQPLRARTHFEEALRHCAGAHEQQLLQLKIRDCR